MPNEKKKIDQLEKEKRIRMVQEWIIEDWPYQDIVKYIVDKTGWEVEERQAQRYISDARKRWVDQNNELTEHKRRLKIETLKKLKRSLNDRFKGTPHGIKAVLSVEKELIKLEGLDLPKKHEITGKDGKAIQTETKVESNVDYSKLPSEILQTIIAARIKPAI
jgi:hypothetical protein